MTRPGRELIAIGVGVGFLFAAVVLVISVVAFPLLLDRTVGVEVAVQDIGACGTRSTLARWPFGD